MRKDNIADSINACIKAKPRRQIEITVNVINSRNIELLRRSESENEHFSSSCILTIN
jgi:hypothetical protein